MKYSLNTFKLYKDESIFAMIMRIRVVMKEKVDVKKLKSAVNIAIKRYPSQLHAASGREEIHGCL